MQFRVGERIAVDSHLGTVKYVGKLPGIEKTWLGVEWDDKSRGKHDGTYSAQRIFFSDYPTGCSFIPMERALKGRTLDAVLNDFCQTSNFNTSLIENVYFSKDDMHSSISVHFLDLSFRQVVESNESVISPLHNVDEVNLSFNLFSNWLETLRMIFLYFPNCINLNLSGNRFEFENFRMFECSSYIRILSINNVNFSWQKIMDVSPCFPLLEELHASHNAMKQLSSTELCDNCPFPKLTLLDLQYNLFSSWSFLYSLSCFSSLSTLIVNGNNLGNSDYCDQAVPLPGVKSLSIAENGIRRVKVLYDICHLFPSLSQLNILSNTIESPFNDQRMLMISIFPVLKLNNSEVLYCERCDAEQWFISRCHSLMKTMNDGDVSSFYNVYLNLASLEQKYSRPFCTEAPSIHGRRFVAVFLKYENTTVSKQIPKTITIRKLRLLMEQIFHAKRDIFHLDSTGTFWPLRDDFKELEYYNVCTNDSIVMK